MSLRNRKRVRPTSLLDRSLVSQSVHRAMRRQSLQEAVQSRMLTQMLRQGLQRGSSRALRQAQSTAPIRLGRKAEMRRQ